MVVLLLSGGLIGLLMLNTALNQGSFQLAQLQQQTTTLTDEQQGLQQQIASWSAPDSLAARARGLGMVPGGTPAFLEDNGTVLGSPAPLPPGGGNG
jgi:cell division protein FtsB